MGGKRIDRIASTIREKDLQITNVIGWDKVSFMAFDSHYSHRRMKESFLIDIFAYRGIMNIEDGMKKDACWNVLFPLLCKDFPEFCGT